MIMIIRTVLYTLAVGATLCAQTRRLDPTQFVVMGEGLAAGVQDFGLRLEYQKLSFPALVAKQMNVFMPLPLLQGPGLAVIPGFPSQPALEPNVRQTTVRSGFPPNLFVFNTAVPGMKLADAIGKRPAEPLIRTGDTQQTLINLILGYPELILGKNKPKWSQLEYTEQMRPSLTLVALGYYEAADAAANGDPSRVPDATVFRANLNTILGRLKSLYTETDRKSVV